MTVAEALPVIRGLGITAIWRTGDDNAAEGVDEATIANEYVDDALPRSQGTVYIWVESSRPAPSSYYDALSADC
jgi:hypothetical protein